MKKKQVRNTVQHQDRDNILTLRTHSKFANPLQDRRRHTNGEVREK